MKITGGGDFRIRVQEQCAGKATTSLAGASPTSRKGGEKWGTHFCFFLMSGKDGYSGLAASGTECFRNYILSIFREVESGEFFAGAPADLGGVTGREEFASYCAAQEV